MICATSRDGILCAPAWLSTGRYRCGAGGGCVSRDVMMMARRYLPLSAPVTAAAPAPQGPALAAPHKYLLALVLTVIIIVDVPLW